MKTKKTLSGTHLSVLSLDSPAVVAVHAVLKEFSGRPMTVKGLVPLTGYAYCATKYVLDWMTKQGIVRDFVDRTILPRAGKRGPIPHLFVLKDSRP
jgi:hypothetical protein